MAKTYETVGDMVSGFHTVMGIVCENCKYDATGYGDVRYCENHQAIFSKDFFCGAWEKKDVSTKERTND